MLIRPSSEVIASVKETRLPIQEIIKVISNSNLPLLDNLITGTKGKD
jgi:hypothetical protein